MFRIDGISGIEFCEVDELVNDAVMEQLGFKKVQVFGRSYIYGKNITAYYYKEGCSYVYVECFFVKLNAYTKLIIDKEKFEALGMKDKAVFLNTGKGNGSRAVPSVRYNGKTFAIHKCGHEGKEVDHTQMSLSTFSKTIFSSKLGRFSFVVESVSNSSSFLLSERFITISLNKIVYKITKSVLLIWFI